MLPSLIIVKYWKRITEKQWKKNVFKNWRKNKVKIAKQLMTGWSRRMDLKKTHVKVYKILFIIPRYVTRVLRHRPKPGDGAREKTNDTRIRAVRQSSTAAVAAGPVAAGVRLKHRYTPLVTLRALPSSRPPSTTFGACVRVRETLSVCLRTAVVVADRSECSATVTCR